MRKIVSLILLLITAGFFSCKPKVEEDKPQNLIPKEDFKQLVIDFHLLEAYVERRHGGSDSALVIFKQLEQDLLKKYNYSHKQYLISYNYYLRQMDSQMDPIYEEVVQELSKLEARTKSSERKKKGNKKDQDKAKGKEN